MNGVILIAMNSAKSVQKLLLQNLNENIEFIEGV